MCTALERLEEKGREAGRIEGREEGRAEGRAEGKREILFALLKAGAGTQNHLPPVQSPE